MRSGVATAEPYLAWRDTVNIAAFETLVVNVVQHQLETHMYHCHILEHKSQGMMGAATCGDDMWGHGMPPGGMWGRPSHMTPGLYRSQMQGHMQQVQHRMAAITRETDSAKREALMREHYQSMYRDMQTMRGMGWMWTPNAAASLPDRDSQGAKLVGSICSQCHSPPSPSLHTQAEWAGVTARMRQHMQEQNSAAGAGVRIPSSAELDVLMQYLAEHGADAQARP